LTARGDEAGEEGVCLFVGDSFLVVDAAVQGDVDTEGQESHGVLRSRYATSRSPSGHLPTPGGDARQPSPHIRPVALVLVGELLTQRWLFVGENEQEETSPYDRA